MRHERSWTSEMVPKYFPPSLDIGGLCTQLEILGKCYWKSACNAVMLVDTIVYPLPITRSISSCNRTRDARASGPEPPRGDGFVVTPSYNKAISLIHCEPHTLRA